MIRSTAARKGPTLTATIGSTATCHYTAFAVTFRCLPSCGIANATQAIIEARQWKSQPYRQARAERSAIESLVFTLKEGFEFGEMVRRTHENVLAEMLEKVLAYNISQIIRMRKRLSESQQTQQAAA